MSNFWDSQPQKRPGKARAKEAMIDPMLAGWGISPVDGDVKKKKKVSKKKVVTDSDSSDSDVDVAALAALSSLGYMRAAPTESGKDLLVRKSEQSPFVNDEGDGLELLDPAQLAVRSNVSLPGIPVRRSGEIPAGTWCEALGRHLLQVMLQDVDISVRLERAKLSALLILLALVSAGSVQFDGETVFFDQSRVNALPMQLNRLGSITSQTFSLSQLEQQYSNIVSFSEDIGGNPDNWTDFGSRPFCEVGGGAQDNRVLVQDMYVLQSMTVLLEFNRQYAETTGAPAIISPLLEWTQQYCQYDESSPVFFGSIFGQSIYSAPVGSAVNYFNHLTKTGRSPIAVEQPNSDPFFMQRRGEDEEETVENQDDLGETVEIAHKSKQCVCTLNRDPIYSNIHLLNCRCSPTHYIPAAVIAKDLQSCLSTVAKHLVSGSEHTKKQAIELLCLLLLITPTRVDLVHRAAIRRFEHLDKQIPTEFPNFEGTKYHIKIPMVYRGAYSTAISVKHESNVHQEDNDHAECLELDPFVVLLPLLAIRLSPKVLTAEQQQEAAEKGLSVEKEPAIGVKMGCLHIAALLLQRMGSTVVSAYISDIVMLQFAVLPDPFLFPFAVGRLLSPLCDVAPSVVLAISNDITETVLIHADHKSASIRTALIICLELLMSCGAHELIRTVSGFQEHNVIDVNEFFGKKSRANTLAKLVQDSSPRVRARMAVLLGSTLQAHPHRHDYETLLMPYFLTLQSDGCKEVEMLAHSYFVPIHLSYLHDPALDRSTLVAQSNPHPLTAIVPGQGMQLIALKFGPRLLPAAIDELRAWTAATRGNAARLVLLLLVLSGGNTSQQITNLLPVLVARVYEQYAEAAAKRQYWFPSYCDDENNGQKSTKTVENSLLCLLTHITSPSPVDSDAMDAVAWCFVALVQHAPAVAVWPQIFRGLGVELPQCVLEKDHNNSSAQHAEFSRSTLISASFLLSSISPQSVLFGATVLFNSYKGYDLTIPCSSLHPFALFCTALYGAQRNINYTNIPPITKTDIRGTQIEEIMVVRNCTIYLEGNTVHQSQLDVFAATLLLSSIGMVLLDFAMEDPEKTTTYRLLSADNFQYTLLNKVRGTLPYGSSTGTKEPVEAVHVCHIVSQLLDTLPISQDIMDNLIFAAGDSIPSNISQCALLYYFHLTGAQDAIPLLNAVRSEDLHTAQFVASTLQSLNELRDKE